MKKIGVLIVISLVFIAAGSQSLSAQRVLRIGEKEIKLQSPVTLQDRDRSDILIVRDTVYEQVVVEKAVAKKQKYRRYPRYVEEFYFSLGWAIKTTEQPYLPIYYGNSYGFNIGFKELYRPVGIWAIGTFVQYSSYSYKLRNAAVQDLFHMNVPGLVDKEYYRTDNIGVGIITRIYYSRNNYTEAGVYGDYAFSKRYVVKTYVGGDKEKIKYRDGAKFNALNAGFIGSVNFGLFSVYGKYRLTNLFSQDLDVLEPARWSLGVLMSF